MRPRRSTVAVFVVVALAWFPAFYLAWFAWESMFEDGDCGTTCALADSILFVLKVVAWPLAVVEKYESVSDTMLGDWVGWTAFLISPATWAALITTAFVLIRRVRERRTASKAM